MKIVFKCLLITLILLASFALPACDDDDDGGESDTDSDTDTDTDTDADTDTDTDSDSDTGDGIYQWHTFYGGDDCFDSGSSIALDGSSGLVIVGKSGTPWYGPDNQPPINYPPTSKYYTMYAIKLDSSGNYLWHTFHGGDWWTDASSVAIDGTGNLLVTGHGTSWVGPDGEPPLNSMTDLDSYQAYVLKLDSEGNYLWHTFYGGLYSDNSFSIGVDTEENILITGYSQTSWDGPEGQPPLNPHPVPSQYGSIAILKLSSEGDYQWHTFYGGDDSAEGNAVSFNEEGEITVSGKTFDSWNGPGGQLPIVTFSESGDNAFVLRLDSDGNYIWHTFHGSDGIESSVATYSHALDNEGNIYLTGSSSDHWDGPNGESPLHSFPTSTYDSFILKLNSDGEYQWHTFYGTGKFGSDALNDRGLSITIDQNGDLFITGDSRDPWVGPNGELPLNPHGGEDAEDMFVLKLDHNGEYAWHSFYGSPYDEDAWGVDDSGQSIVVDGSGGIYVAGWSEWWWNGPLDVHPLNYWEGLTDMFVLKLGEYI